MFILSRLGIRISLLTEMQSPTKADAPAFFFYDESYGGVGAVARQKQSLYEGAIGLAGGKGIDKVLKTNAPVS
jgi:hypothetical protein